MWTIGPNRRGLQANKNKDNLFKDLKKKLNSDYDYTIGGEEGTKLAAEGKRNKQKFQGYKKGHFMNRRMVGSPIVINVQKEPR